MIPVDENSKWKFRVAGPSQNGAKISYWRSTSLIVKALQYTYGIERLLRSLSSGIEIRTTINYIDSYYVVGEICLQGSTTLNFADRNHFLES